MHCFASSFFRNTLAEGRKFSPHSLPLKNIQNYDEINLLDNMDQKSFLRLILSRFLTRNCIIYSKNSYGIVVNMKMNHEKIFKNSIIKVLLWFPPFCWVILILKIGKLSISFAWVDCSHFATVKLLVSVMLWHLAAKELFHQLVEQDWVQKLWRKQVKPLMWQFMTIIIRLEHVFKLGWNNLQFETTKTVTSTPRMMA